MNKVNQIMDDLDFFKRTLDLIRIWLQASREVHKFTQPKTIVRFYVRKTMFMLCLTTVLHRPIKVCFEKP